jgi:hypothetical protein
MHAARWILLTTASWVACVPPIDPATMDVQLPQAIRGGLFANPAVAETVPLHIEASLQAPAGCEAHLVVHIDGVEVATTDVLDGPSTVDLPLAELSDGFHDLSVRSRGRGCRQIDAWSWSEHTLAIGRGGLRWTDPVEVGSATDPRLHLHDGGLWLSWVDEAQTPRSLRYQELDGAGRPVGDVLSPLPDPEGVRGALMAAPQRDRLAILSQSGGASATTRFRMLNDEGDLLFGPLDLPAVHGPIGQQADLAWDGRSFVAAWLGRSAAGDPELFWLKLDTASLEAVGPLVVATEGTGSSASDPHGRFVAGASVAVAAMDGWSAVAFTRELWHSELAASMPTSQIAIVEAGGEAGVSFDLRSPEDDGAHHDTGAFAVAGTLLLPWVADHGGAGGNEPSMELRISELASPDAGAPASVATVRAEGGRGEPSVIDHPGFPAVLVWVDGRSGQGLSSGQPRIMVAPLAPDWTADESLARVFEDARVAETGGGLGAVALGTNLLVAWLDRGSAPTETEIHLDVAWY